MTNATKADVARLAEMLLPVFQQVFDWKDSRCDAIADFADELRAGKETEIPPTGVNSTVRWMVTHEGYEALGREAAAIPHPAGEAPLTCAAIVRDLTREQA